MARIRTLKPEFWLSEKMAGLPFESRLLAIALLNFADDEGFFRANPALVKAACFPLDDSVNITGMLHDLSKIGWIRAGKTASGEAVDKIVNFLDHQRINKPTKSKYDINSIIWSEFTDESVKTPELLPEDYARERKGKERKGGTTSAASKPEKPPTVEFTETAFTVPPQILTVWKSAYPAVDVEIEIQAAAAWILSNPKNRKSNWSRFLTNWLKRAQDRAPPAGRTNGAVKPSMAHASHMPGKPFADEAPPAVEPIERPESYTVRKIKAEIAAKKVQRTGWWTSPAGIFAKGQENDIQQQPGESASEFKCRLFARLEPGPHLQALTEVEQQVVDRFKAPEPQEGSIRPDVDAAVAKSRRSHQ